MKPSIAVLVAVAVPAIAGDLHGHVAAKGVRDSADAEAVQTSLRGDCDQTRIDEALRAGR